MFEKEYKFLVNRIPYSENVVFIKQYYFDTEKLLGVAINWLKLDTNQTKEIDSIRVRQCIFENETKYFLTAKSKGNFCRQEYETQIQQKPLLSVTTNICSCEDLYVIQKSPTALLHL